MINVPNIKRVMTHDRPATELTKLEYAAIHLAAAMIAEGTRSDTNVQIDSVDMARNILDTLSPVTTNPRGASHV